jgi:hypothetical protein
LEYVIEIAAAFVWAVLFVYGVNRSACAMMDRSDALSADVDIPDPDYVWN